MSDPKQITYKPTNHRRNRSLFLVLLIAALLGCIWFMYWYFHGRFYIYTNDAYVGGNIVVVTPRISGTVVSISADDTDYVEQGRILVELDQTDALIALEKNIANLGQSVRQVTALLETTKQIKALISVKKALFIQAAQDYERRERLVDALAVSLEDFEHSITAVNSSFADLISTEHYYLSLVAQTANTTIEEHPLVEEAKQLLREAFLMLQRCTLFSPVEGLVARRSIQVGEQINPAQPLMAIIPLNQIWVDANYKETQLRNVRIGQIAKVHCDLYGSSVDFEGIVGGIAGGTGSVFSLLPPQNATGNWIKIVQRLPVRVYLNPEQIKKHPLRLGLSMETTINVHQENLPVVPVKKPALPIYSTDIFYAQQKGVEELIAEVIEQNIPQRVLEDL
ncbi:MAG TPA: efflux RND transporter periplasmic adaptor subunit [Candidatus Rhabdochlamydia sp.]|jgi:membrane fusion protein, multidrug efflux system|nr:efflux RND transporter periplasmic adaptor subunit [Candidatus Rhabdochlamydia sp.]